MRRRVIAGFIAIATLAGCSASAVPTAPWRSGALANAAARGFAAKSPQWGVQITGSSAGSVAVFQYAICDAKVYTAKPPCTTEYNDAPFVMKAALNNHADVNWKGCTTSLPNDGFGTCGTRLRVASELGRAEISGYTYATPTTVQQGGDPAEFLYASPGFTDVATVKSATLQKGAQAQIKAVLTLEVIGTKDVCKQFHFADVSATANDTAIYSGITQTYMQQITGGCNPNVFVLKSLSNGHPVQTTKGKLSITMVTTQQVGTSGPIAFSTFYQTGSSSSPGGKRAQTSVRMLVTFRMLAATKGVTLKFASGHPNN